LNELADELNKLGGGQGAASQDAMYTGMLMDLMKAVGE